MVKGEKAVISCPAEYATNSALLPRPPDHPDRVEFELHLLNLAQVCLCNLQAKHCCNYEPVLLGLAAVAAGYWQ